MLFVYLDGSYVTIARIDAFDNIKDLCHHEDGNCLACDSYNICYPEAEKNHNEQIKLEKDSNKNFDNELFLIGCKVGLNSFVEEINRVSDMFKDCDELLKFINGLRKRIDYSLDTILSTEYGKQLLEAIKKD